MFINIVELKIGADPKRLIEEATPTVSGQLSYGLRNCGGPEQ